MKKQVDILDATPSKRLYLSIIADYDLNKAICELIDNALDIWTRNNRMSKLCISILLDMNQQTITVKDNSGGISKEDLSNVVGPGHTSNVEHDETIGIFGVETKRAVVALAQDVKIKQESRMEILIRLNLMIIGLCIVMIGICRFMKYRRLTQIQRLLN